jgi:ATP-dependent DNA helicase RecG
METRRESEAEEWAESWRNDHLRTLAAFANSGDGGILKIGVNDKGEVVGVRNAKKLAEEIPGIVSSKLGFFPQVEARTSDGKEYVVVRIRSQPSAASYNGRFYIRSGSATREISGREIVELQMEKEGIAWADRKADGASEDDLSREALEYLVRLGKSKRRLPDGSSADNALGILRHLDLIRDGRITISAALLFHPRPESLFPGACVRIGAFSGDGRLLRDDSIEGPVIMQPEETVEALYEKHIQGTYSIKGLYRETERPYPDRAVREAVLNMIVHRDYSVPRPSTVRVYPDRVEMFSYGGLPKGWTVQKLLSDHETMPRNYKIARAFYSAGLAEQWGTGIKAIFDSCREAGLPDPEYSEADGGVRLVLRRAESAPRLGILGKDS